MRRLQIALVVAFVTTVVLAGAVVARSWADLSLRWHVIASGGGRAASGSYAVAGSIAQPMVGAAQSSGYRLGAGFWYGARAPAPPTPTPTSTTPPPPTATPTTPPTGAHWLYLPVLVKNH
jgi:hypothetical protein